MLLRITHTYEYVFLSCERDGYNISRHGGNVKVQHIRYSYWTFYSSTAAVGGTPPGPPLQGVFCCSQAQNTNPFMILIVVLMQKQPRGGENHGGAIRINYDVLPVSFLLTLGMEDGSTADK